MHKMPIAFITALSVAVILGSGTAPGMTWLDAGDFVTASATLGVPHPTGFPVYTVLGHLFSYLPMGNLASRTALMSAIFAGITVWFLMATIEKRARFLCEKLAVGGALTLVHLSADTLGLNGRMPEVYTLNTAAAAACIYLMDRLERSADVRSIALLGFACGLGAANHALFSLFALGFVAAAFSIKTARRLGAVMTFVAVSAITSAAYAYLPLAASRSPAHNFGDPSSLPRFLAHITAAEIRQSFSHEMAAGWFVTVIHLKQMISQLYQALGPFLILGIAGMLYPIFSLVRPGEKRRVDRLGLLAGALTAADLFFATVIHPMGIQSFQNGQMSILLICVSGALTTARGIVFLSKKASARVERLGYAVASALPLFLLFYIPKSWGDTASDWSPEDLTVIHLAHAEPGSLSVLVSDSMIAASLYARHAVDARPDVAVLDRNLLQDKERITYAFRHFPFEVLPEAEVATWAPLSGPLSEATYLARAARLITHNIGLRTVYWEAPVGRADLSIGFELLHRFPMGSIAGDEDDASACVPDSFGFCASNAAIDIPNPAFIGASERFRSWSAGQWGYAGARFYEKGALQQAAVAFENAHRLAPSSIAWKNNLAVIAAASGNIKGALDIVDNVLLKNPLSITAVKNGLLYSRALGDKSREAAYLNLAKKLGLKSGSGEQPAP